MHIETVGYIGIKRNDTDKIREWISFHELSDMDCHEDEIVTDVNPEAIKEVIGDFISEDEAKTLIEKCDVIKFYM